MIRLTKQTDYGIRILARMASTPPATVHTARGLSDGTGLPLPMVSKVLKTLGKEKLLLSHRGVKGGYRLARPADRIAVSEVIAALEGPVNLVECASRVPGECRVEGNCQVRSHWQVINDAVLGALNGLMLSEMVGPAPVGVINLASRI